MAKRQARTQSSRDVPSRDDEDEPFLRLIPDFIQDLTEEQWRMISDDPDHPEINEPLSNVCKRIVESLNNDVVKSIMPGLHNMLGIKGSPDISVSGRTLTASSATQRGDVKFNKAEMPKRGGSGKLSMRPRVQTPYQFSTGQKEEDCRSHTSQSEKQAGCCDSEALRLLLGVPDNSLFACIKDSLRQCLNNINKRGKTGKTSTCLPYLSPAIIASVVQIVNLNVALLIKSANSSRESSVTSAGGGTSGRKSTEDLIKELSVKLERVNRWQPLQTDSPPPSENETIDEKDISGLTWRLMIAISDVMGDHVDEKEHHILDSVTQKMKMLASLPCLKSHCLDMLMSAFGDCKNICGATSSCSHNSSCLKKISSQEFQTSAQEVVRKALTKRMDSLTSSKSPSSSNLFSTHPEKLNLLQKLNAGLPGVAVASAASAVVKSFVAGLKSLSESVHVSKITTWICGSEDVPSQQRNWSTAAHLFHSVENNVRDFFSRLNKLASRFGDTDTDYHFPIPEGELTVPSLSLAKRGSKSLTQLPGLKATANVNLQRGISDVSKSIWAEESPENKVLLTCCTTELITDLVRLSNAGSSIEEDGFPADILSHLQEISLPRVPSLIKVMSGSQKKLKTLDIQSTTSGKSLSTLSTNSIHGLLSPEFLFNAVDVLTEILIKSSATVTNTTPLRADTAWDLVQTLESGFQELTQPMETLDIVETSIETDTEVSKRQIWDVATKIYLGMQDIVCQFLTSADLETTDTTNSQFGVTQTTTTATTRSATGNDSNGKLSCEVDGSRKPSPNELRSPSPLEWDPENSPEETPGTPSTNVQAHMPIIRNTIIDDSFNIEDNFPKNLVANIRQTAGAFADMMMESIEKTESNVGKNDLPSAVSSLERIISTELIHILKKDFMEKGRSTSGSILSRLQWGEEPSDGSRKLSSQLLHIFAEESVRCAFKRLLKPKLTYDLLIEENPNTSSQKIVPIRIIKKEIDHYCKVKNELTVKMISRIETSCQFLSDYAGGDYIGLVSMLVLRLLKDISPAVSDTIDVYSDMRNCISERVLAHFCSASGFSETQSYHERCNLHKIEMNVYKWLLNHFGTEIKLQKAVEFQTCEFMDLMVASLTEELQYTCGYSVKTESDREKTMAKKSKKKRFCFELPKISFNQKKTKKVANKPAECQQHNTCPTMHFTEASIPFMSCTSSCQTKNSAPSFLRRMKQRVQGLFCNRFTCGKNEN